MTMLEWPRRLLRLFGARRPEPPLPPEVIDPLPPVVIDTCIYCGSATFEPGPRGGASHNITCLGCGARFNILDYPGVPRYLINILSGPTR